MSFTVYILRTSKNTLYVGQTQDLDKRLKEHNKKSGSGAKYLRAFASIEVVHTETFATRSEALKREHELKQLTHKQKEALLQKR